MGSTYVLVHGSWHGGWCWTPVVRRLEELGHRAYAPTLAGHGPDVERAGITHEDCVDSIVQYIEVRQLRDIILVGHSFGGTIISRVAQRIPDRLRRLVFWSAFVVGDGESLSDNVPPQYRELFEQMAKQSSDNTVMMPWDIWRTAFMQDAGEEEARIAYNLLTPEPYQPFVAKLDQKRFFELDIPKSYIHCRQDVSLPPGEWAWYPRFGMRLGPHKLVEMDGSHESCFTRPTELADAIVEASSD